jgi:hypothetical protein
MSLVTSKMQGRPIIKSFIVDFYRVIILPRVNHLACFIIEAVFAEISEFLIIKVYVCPKLIPSITCRLLKHYINKYLPFKPAVIREATSSYSSS